LKRSFAGLPVLVVNRIGSYFYCENRFFGRVAIALLEPDDCDTGIVFFLLKGSGSGLFTGSFTA
jgi:hypothetical protein